eukprot:jgi/Chlat1/4853/Chrsp31S04882
MVSSGSTSSAGPKVSLSGRTMHDDDDEEEEVVVDGGGKLSSALSLSPTGAPEPRSPSANSPGTCNAPRSINALRVPVTAAAVVAARNAAGTLGDTRVVDANGHKGEQQTRSEDVVVAAAVVVVIVKVVSMECFSLLQHIHILHHLLLLLTLQHPLHLLHHLLVISNIGIPLRQRPACFKPRGLELVERLEEGLTVRWGSSVGVGVWVWVGIVGVGEDVGEAVEEGGLGSGEEGQGFAAMGVICVCDLERAGEVEGGQEGGRDGVEEGFHSRIDRPHHPRPRIPALNQPQEEERLQLHRAHGLGGRLGGTLVLAVVAAGICFSWRLGRWRRRRRGVLVEEEVEAVGVHGEVGGLDELTALWEAKRLRTCVRVFHVKERHLDREDLDPIASPPARPA